MTIYPASLLVNVCIAFCVASVILPVNRSSTERPTESWISSSSLSRSKRDLLSDIFNGITQPNRKLSLRLKSVKHEVGDEYEDKPLSEKRREKQKQNKERHKNKAQTVKQNTAEDPMVLSSEGMLRGVLKKENDLEYYSFLGIPYASKPETRFQAAKPPIPWDGVRNATKDGTMCAQFDGVFHNIGGSEDCLFLNIHTTTLSNKALPVLLFIHGGAFKYGSGSTIVHGPAKILRNEVVVATINYRLGIFGFLCLGTEKVPGNAGLKDTVAGLRWIQKNIKLFGGDPNNVCIYGISSGSMVVEYLTLSPMAKGLFSKAICHSGSTLSSWAFNNNPKRDAFALGKYTGNDTIDLDELAEHLKNASVADLVKGEKKMTENVSPGSDFTIPFVPCAEKQFPGEESFLTDTPENVFKSGNYNKVPTLVGFNDKEGLYFFKRITNLTTHLKSVDGTLDFFIPPEVFRLANSLQAREEIVNKVKQFYFKGSSLNENEKENYIDFMGDVSFMYSAYRSVLFRLRDPKYPVYFYEFAYDGPLKITAVNSLFNISGVAHADDIGYVFSMLVTKLREREPEPSRVSKTLITLYTNFMKYGNPTPSITDILPIKWDPIQSEETLDYLRITTKLEMKQRPNYERYKFWSELYSNAGL